jgi:hypothetical protein
MTSPDQTKLVASGQEKITLDHRQRLAYIYIRQSSP